MFFEQFDFFGDQISFTYKNNQKFKSSLGGVVTLILGVLTILLLYGLGQNFFKRQNPRFVKEDIFVKNSTMMPINNSNFPIAFKIENGSGGKIPKTNLYLKMSSEETTKKLKEDLMEYESVYSMPINLKPCTEDLFDNKEVFDKYNFRDYECPIMNETIGGSYTENTIKYLYVTVNLCRKNFDEEINDFCDDENNTISLLDQGNIYLSTLLQFPLIQPSNYTTGIKQDFVLHYFVISNKILKSVFYFFKKIKLISDYGWLIEDKMQEETFGYSYKENDASFKDINYNDDGVLAWLTINIEKDTVQYIREYEKISNLAANVGGILKIFLVIGASFVSLYNQLKFKSQIAKYCFEYCNEEDNLKSCKTFEKKNSIVFDDPDLNKIKIGEYSVSNTQPYQSDNIRNISMNNFKSKKFHNYDNNMNKDMDYSIYDKNSKEIKVKNYKNKANIENINNIEDSNDGSTNVNSLELSKNTLCKKPQLFLENKGEKLNDDKSNENLYEDYKDTFSVINHMFLKYICIFCHKSINYKNIEGMLAKIDSKLSVNEYLINTLLIKKKSSLQLDSLVKSKEKLKLSLKH